MDVNMNWMYNMQPCSHVIISFQGKDTTVQLLQIKQVVKVLVV